MVKPDPFGFDIRVKSDKQKRSKGKRGMSGAFETSQRVCEHPSCEEAGKYRAPKSPDTLDEYYWFCKDHVREYNNRWNFYEGKTEAEMNAQMWSEDGAFEYSDEYEVYADEETYAEDV